MNNKSINNVFVVECHGARIRPLVEAVSERITGGDFVCCCWTKKAIETLRATS